MIVSKGWNWEKDIVWGRVFSCSCLPGLPPRCFPTHHAACSQPLPFTSSFLTQTCLFIHVKPNFCLLFYKSTGAKGLI